MSQYETDVDNDHDGDTSAKGLRAQLEQALADKKRLETELSSLHAETRQTKVTSYLNSKGINPKVAKLLPADVSEGEAIDKWLEDYSDVFGISTEAPTPTPANDEALASQQRVNQLSQSAADPSAVLDWTTRIKNASSEAELDRVMTEMQSARL